MNASENPNKIPLSQLLTQIIDQENGIFTVNCPDSWTQGRTLFGGLQGALAMHAMRQALNQTPEILPLRSLQMTFIAPVSAGKVRIAVNILRQGKTATHLEAKLYDAKQQLGSTILAIFGTPRESILDIKPEILAAKRPPEACTPMPFIPNMTPNFTQYLDMRWAAGGYPYSGAEKARTQIYLKYQEVVDFFDEAHIIALGDGVPTPGLSVMKKITMASSMTWNIDVISPLHLYATQTGHWRMDTLVEAATDGYLVQTAILIAPDQTSVAYCRQLVGMFG